MSMASAQLVMNPERGIFLIVQRGSEKIKVRLGVGPVNIAPEHANMQIGRTVLED